MSNFLEDFSFPNLIMNGNTLIAVQYLVTDPCVC